MKRRLRLRRSHAVAALEMLGFLLIVAGFALVRPIAGLFAGGVAAIILAYLWEPQERGQ